MICTQNKVIIWVFMLMGDHSIIYETRIYETHPGKLPALNDRFRNHTMKIFEKHGIKNIGYWTSNVGEFSDRLTYIIAFEDQGHRESAWAAFSNDPEWVKVRTESELDGPIVKRVFNNLLNPTDYSPLQ